MVLGVTRSLVKRVKVVDVTSLITAVKIKYLKVYGDHLASLQRGNVYKKNNLLEVVYLLDYIESYLDNVKDKREISLVLQHCNRLLTLQ